MVHEKIFLATHLEIQIPNSANQNVTIRKQDFIYEYNFRGLNLILEYSDSIEIQQTLKVMFNTLFHL